MDPNTQYLISERILGKGAEGEILVAKNISNNQICAVKILDKSNKRIIRKPKRAYTELNIFSRIQNRRFVENEESDDDIIQIETLHPNIIRLFHVDENNSSVRLFLEYCEFGSLQDFLRKNVNLGKNLKMKLFLNILDAVCFLHDVVHVCHRDIKVKNILVTKNYVAKLCDFGFATDLRNDEFLHKKCGTINSMAPEIICKKPYLGRKADSWSLGVVFYYIFYNMYPYTGIGNDQLESNVLAKPLRIPLKASSVEYFILRSLLRKNPASRLTPSQLKQHLSKNGFCNIKKDLPLNDQNETQINENNQQFL